MASNRFYKKFQEMEAENLDLYVRDYWSSGNE